LKDSIAVLYRGLIFGYHIAMDGGSLDSSPDRSRSG
jgi:hypothetical protein